ncbi:MAG: hypothetical protein PHQ12_00990 [Chthoniobacteraceae bacterium]|nr:hypothetical protein [Chthoniobacteraceae bacterium]
MVVTRGYHHRYYHGPRAVVVRPAPVYAYHPYRHHHRLYGSNVVVVRRGHGPYHHHYWAR